MPHGTPDWGLTGPKYTTYGLDDMAEQAVRLGSPHLFDRRGDVIWMTDFRNGRQDIHEYNTPANGTVNLWAGNARQGAFCAQLAALTGLAMGLQKPIAYPVLSRIGLEFTFSIHLRSNYIVGQILADDAVNMMEAFVRYDEGNDVLEYRDNVGVGFWQNIASNLNLGHTDYAFHTLKIVADLGATPPAFVRVILNDVTYNAVAGIPLRLGATAGMTYLYVRIEHEADGAGDAEIQVDNIIVTQNEP